MKISSFKNAIIALTILTIPSLGYGQTDTPQDPAQLAADQAECQQHAMAYSGYNPAATAQPSDSSPPPQRGAGLRGGARGAARGAVAGGVIEEIDDDGDRDQAAEMGAALGGMRGVSQGRRAARAQPQATPPPPVPAGDPELYSTSYNDCMTSRGYATQ